MTNITTRFALASALALAFTAVVGNHRPLVAQTASARPAVTIAQLTRLYFSIRIADFNEDGRPDLIGSTAAHDLQIALGRGDGTFGTPRSLNVTARSLAVGDFNGDGHQDLVVEGVAILPGRGDGTFRAARVVGDIHPGFDNDLEPSAIPADFNGDGKLDLAIIDVGVVTVYPGKGDFTFGQRVELPTTDEGFGSLTAADFNRDGRLDLAATSFGTSFDIFLNQGSLVFNATTIGLTSSMWDIAAADFNHDQKPDLVITTSSNDGSAGYGPGAFHILLGDGTGSFPSLLTYGIGVHGALPVAVGDFNHDGVLDVATGNRSTRAIDQECTPFHYWDSVTISAGVGDGSFRTPASFRLGTLNVEPEFPRNAINRLSAGDFNGDGFTDLVASPGAIVMTHPATANRPPVARGGPTDSIQANTETSVLDGIATDPDFDWLDFEWRNSAGTVIGPHFGDLTGLPMICESLPAGTYVFTANDRHGGIAGSNVELIVPSRPDIAVEVSQPARDAVLGTASPFTISWFRSVTDGIASFRISSSADNGLTFAPIAGCQNLPPTATSCVWNTPGPAGTAARVRVDALDSHGTVLSFDASDRFSIAAGPSPMLRQGWSQIDVGPVGAPGSALDDGTTMTVTGDGTDIWGTADQFHYVFMVMRGDFDAIARVKSVQNVDRWTKAGLMIRAHGAPNAAHGSLFVTPTTEKGLAFQARPVSGGDSVTTPGPAITAPVWIRLSRARNVVTAYYRVADRDPWTKIGSRTVPDLTDASDAVQVGLAVTSHVHGTLATAVFDNIQVGGPQTALPPGWSDEDIGAVAALGTASGTTSAFTVAGSGADVWSTADEFHWAFRPATGNFSIETLVDSVQNIDRWTKAGLMIREDSTPGSRHASFFLTPTTEKGFSFQARPTAGGSSIEVIPERPAVAPPMWLRLTRQGDTITAHYRKSVDLAWQNFGSITLAGLAATVKVGLAVTSHHDGLVATAHFSQLTIEPILDWTTLRIGSGEAHSFLNGTFFSAQNRGIDIWGTSDSFTYVYTRWSGDGAITARINHLDFTDPWVKGGLMIRESLASNAKHAFVFTTGERGTPLQYRASTGGISATAATIAGLNAPGEFAKGFWLQLVREGSAFKAYYSLDKLAWQQIGQIAVVMPDDVYIGLAVTSHNINELAWGLFDDVTVRRGAFQPTPVPPIP